MDVVGCYAKEKNWHKNEQSHESNSSPRPNDIRIFCGLVESFEIVTISRHAKCHSGERKRKENGKGRKEAKNRQREKRGERKAKRAERKRKANTDQRGEETEQKSEEKTERMMKGEEIKGNK